MATELVRLPRRFLLSQKASRSGDSAFRHRSSHDPRPTTRNHEYENRRQRKPSSINRKKNKYESHRRWRDGRWGVSCGAPVLQCSSIARAGSLKVEVCSSKKPLLDIFQAREKIARPVKRDSLFADEFTK
jgi:hypothetical protein